MKKFVCTVCGYVFEGEDNGLQNTLSVFLRALAKTSLQI